MACHNSVNRILTHFKTRVLLSIDLNSVFTIFKIIFWLSKSHFFAKTFLMPFQKAIPGAQ